MFFLFMCCVFLFKVRLIRTVRIVLFFMQAILDTTYYYICMCVMLCRQVLNISVSIHFRQRSGTVRSYKRCRHLKGVGVGCMSEIHKQWLLYVYIFLCCLFFTNGKLIFLLFSLFFKISCIFHINISRTSKEKMLILY